MITQLNAPASADVCTWRERGGLTNLVKVPLDPITPGMVRVAKAGDNWREHPELVFQVWPEDLEPVAGGARP